MFSRITRKKGSGCNYPLVDLLLLNDIHQVPYHIDADLLACVVLALHEKL